MKILSVTRTGNECDIIEAFVRHHARLVDMMLIIDDDSSDGTAEILARLKAEGLPLELFRAGEVDWDQTAFITRLMHLGFDRHGADWVAALDVDEFVEVPPNASLADLLPADAKDLVGLPWSNFVWQATLNPKVANPVLRLRARMPARLADPKPLIPRGAVLGDPGAYVLHGNHGLSVRGQRLTPRIIEGIGLGHYPIRSVDQFIGKAVINYLRYVARFGAVGKVAFQYRKPLELIKNDPAGLAREMERASKIYGLPDGAKSEGRPVERPLRYLGGPLKYVDSGRKALSNIVTHAEVLARRVAELERVAPVRG